MWGQQIQMTLAGWNPMLQILPEQRLEQQDADTAAGLLEEGVVEVALRNDAVQGTADMVAVDLAVVADAYTHHMVDNTVDDIGHVVEA